MATSNPTIIFVKQPEQIIDNVMKSQRPQKKKVEEPFDLTILEKLHQINIAKNFRKFMDSNLMQSQHPDYYKIDSEFVKDKFNKLLDGIAEITVEVRNDEGVIQNEEGCKRILKIPLFNEDSMYFCGYHYACLFMEENEEAWFIFDDGYTAPQSFTRVLLSYDTQIERQSQNMIYKIKLHKLKLVQKKREKEGQEYTPEEIQQVKQEEIKRIKEFMQEFSEKRTTITEEYFRKNQFKQAYEKYKRLQINLENNMNRFAKYVEPTNEDLITMKSFKKQIGQNKIVAAFKAELYLYALEEVQQQLVEDPENQKNMYFNAKCLYKLAYYDKALPLLQQYLLKFPDDNQTKTDFEGYIQFCLKKQNNYLEKEKKLYPKVIENLQNEEQKEKLRKLNEQSIEQNLKKDKELIINKILNKDGYEFNTDTDLLKEFQEDEDDQYKTEPTNDGDAD